MIIKEAKYKKKRVQQNVRISEEVYGCDECNKEIKEYPNETGRLDLTIFFQNNETERLHFCSWKCVLKALPKIKTDYFITLPMIHYGGDECVKGKDAKAFMKVLSKL